MHPLVPFVRGYLVECTAGVVLSAQVNFGECKALPSHELDATRKSILTIDDGVVLVALKRSHASAIRVAVDANPQGFFMSTHGTNEGSAPGREVVFMCAKTQRV